MDWNEQCCLLSSPSACVSPSDPTLTVENVREVMAEVGHWVGDGDESCCLRLQAT